MANRKAAADIVSAAKDVSSEVKLSKAVDDAHGPKARLFQSCDEVRADESGSSGDDDHDVNRSMR